jgi:hypothetical protein
MLGGTCRRAALVPWSARFFRVSWAAVFLDSRSGNSEFIDIGTPASYRAASAFFATPSAPPPLNEKQLMIITRTPFPHFLLWRRHRLSRMVSPARRRRPRHLDQQVLLSELPVFAPLLRAQFPHCLYQERELRHHQRNLASCRARNAGLPGLETRPGNPPRRRFAGARGGMGSSSAFTVGLLHALLWFEGPIGQQTGPERAEPSTIEQDILHETVGSQDQIAAAYGGLNEVSFPHQWRTLRSTPITISEPGALHELESHLMLVYTGIRRTASDVAKSYVEDIEKAGRAD